MFNHNPQAFIDFAMYVTLSLVTLWFFLRMFVLFTPNDNIQKVREGDLPHSIILSGVMIGFTIPLLICSFLESGIILFLELALFIGVIQLILEKLLSYWLVEKNNATAVFHASISICVGAIVGFSIIP
jgi:uncharacterized membrane protein YjfL (UPF0719 family)